MSALETCSFLTNVLNPFLFPFLMLLLWLVLLLMLLILLLLLFLLLSAHRPGFSSPFASAAAPAFSFWTELPTFWEGKKVASIFHSECTSCQYFGRVKRFDLFFHWERTWTKLPTAPPPSCIALLPTWWRSNCEKTQILFVARHKYQLWEDTNINCGKTQIFVMNKTQTYIIYKTQI